MPGRSAVDHGPLADVPVCGDTVSAVDGEGKEVVPAC